MSGVLMLAHLATYQDNLSPFKFVRV